MKDVALLRLAAQRVVGPGLPTATEVVRHLTCMQAQDLPGALASVVLRTGAGDAGAAGGARSSDDGPPDREPTGAGIPTPSDAAGIRGALGRGEVVRSWPMRGTLHLVPAEDLRWMLSLTTERMFAGAARRREQLGIDEAMLERAGAVVQDALHGGRSLSRAELMALWDEAGLTGVGQRGYHLLWSLSQRGLTCFGPMDGTEQRIVLLDEWVPRPRVLDRDEALGEWALRYFRGHGPATRKDFMWWTKLTGREVTAGLAVARQHLEVLDVDGTEHFLDPATPALLAEHQRAARAVVLLPGFDEMILGYQDRSATLPPQYADRIVPGGNGVFRPTVVSRGRVVATWRWVGSGASRRVEVEPFTTLAPAVERSVTRLAGTYPARV